MPPGRAGFTLIEMMIVSVIVSILMLVSLPGYREQVRKSHRAMAKAELHKLVLRQEQFFIERRRYANNLGELGLPGDVCILGKDGSIRDLAYNAGIYRLSMLALQNSYSVQAQPMQKDTRCGQLSLSGLGVRAASGKDGVGGCW